jgi:hypothetical protein
VAVLTDVINERTAAAGVTVDGLLIKDGGVPDLTPEDIGAEVAGAAALRVAKAGDTMTGTLKVGANPQVEGAGVLVSYPVDSTVSGGQGWHGFRDESTINLTAATINNAYACVDLEPIIGGTSSYDHYRGLQVRLDHIGAGTIGTVSHVDIVDVSGTGPVTTNIGLYIAPITRGTTTNWAIQTNSASMFGGNNAFGTSTAQPVYPVHVRGNIDTSFNGVVVQNTNTGGSAISSIVIGEDVVTKYLSVFVYGTNFTDSASRLSAVFLADTGLTNGMTFWVRANAPLRFNTNNATRLTISGTGDATFTNVVTAPSVDLSGTGAVMRMRPETATSGFGNYMRWHRSSDNWEAAAVGQNYTGSGGGYGSRLVFGANRGNTPTDVVQVMSLTHNGAAVIINMAGLPTSAAGLVTGDIWNNGGVLNVV